MDFIDDIYWYDIYCSAEVININRVSLKQIIDTNRR